MTKQTLLSVLLVVAVACNRNDATDEIRSDVVLQWDTTNYVLDSCTATIEDNTVRLHFASRIDSLQEYEVNLVKRDSLVTAMISQVSAPADCMYIAARFKVLKQDITLNKKTYKKGDKLEGQFELSLLGHKPYLKEPGEDTLRQNFDTIKLFGGLKTKIQ